MSASISFGLRSAQPASENRTHNTTEENPSRSGHRMLCYEQPTTDSYKYLYPSWPILFGPRALRPEIRETVSSKSISMLQYIRPWIGSFINLRTVLFSPDPQRLKLTHHAIDNFPSTPTHWHEAIPSALVYDLRTG